MIYVNGTPHDVDGEPTIDELLRTHGVDPEAGGIAVAVDAEVAARGSWRTTTLSDGARVEIVTAVQGG